MGMLCVSKGIVDFNPVKVPEDSSLIYDIFLKFNRLVNIMHNLNEALENGNSFLVKREEWLYDFILCCGYDIKGEDSIILFGDEISLVKGYIPKYVEDLFSRYPCKI